MVKEVSMSPPDSNSTTVPLHVLLVIGLRFLFAITVLCARAWQETGTVIDFSSVHHHHIFSLSLMIPGLCTMCGRETIIQQYGIYYHLKLWIYHKQSYAPQTHNMYQAYSFDQPFKPSKTNT